MWWEFTKPKINQMCDLWRKQICCHKNLEEHCWSSFLTYWQKQKKNSNLSYSFDSTFWREKKCAMFRWVVAYQTAIASEILLSEKRLTVLQCLYIQKKIGVRMHSCQNKACEQSIKEGEKRNKVKPINSTKIVCTFP